jgi:hypothetical protein
MNIHPKWQRFALMQFLCDWTGEPESLFQTLLDADYGKCQAIFDGYCVDVWEPFENHPADDIAEYIIQLATTAQQTEEQTK